MGIEMVMKEMHADELYFKRNHIQAERGATMSLNPMFTRQVRSVENNGRMLFVTLSVSIESAAESLKPFDLRVSLTGTFELSEPTQDGFAEEAAKASDVLYPYVRSAVTTLTANAFIPPVVLPALSGPLFPEDRTDVPQPEGPVS